MKMFFWVFGVIFGLEILSTAINWNRVALEFEGMRPGQRAGTIIGQFILFPLLVAGVVWGFQRLFSRRRAET